MWQLQVRDPSGENRSFPLSCSDSGTRSIGRSPDCDLPLRDATLPAEIGVLWATGSKNTKEKGSPFWIKLNDQSKPALLADVMIREANLPEEVPIVLGETEIRLSRDQESHVPPRFPTGVKPWLTKSDEGVKLLWMTKKAAATPLSIYLAGETGTGKEVLAHLIHAWSERSGAPFVPLHCGALPLSLAESELFGHVKGSFTGAVNSRPGALMQAHGGTLFLDEIGDLPLDIQVKILRFLEDGEIRPVGSDRMIRADVRIICATHHHLRQLVEEGRFRRDLFYRLASVTIEIPPLRERIEDIELLARRFARDLHKNLSPQTMLRLQSYNWPGNVRELRHSIERACGLAGPFTTILQEDAFDFRIDAGTEEKTGSEQNFPILSLDEMERVLLLKSLRLAKGNRSKAAKVLGVARSTLFEMLKRHKIQGPRAVNQ